MTDDWKFTEPLVTQIKAIVAEETKELRKTVNLQSDVIRALRNQLRMVELLSGAVRKKAQAESFFKAFQQEMRAAGKTDKEIDEYMKTELFANALARATNL